MNMEEQLEQPPAKKSRTDNYQDEPENGQGNDANLANSPQEADKDLGTPAMDLAPSRRRLPLEMNCEMYKFLKFPIQKKFIWGLGRGIYEMFGQKLLKKTKRVHNPHKNHLNVNNTRTAVSTDGLHVRNNTVGRLKVFADQPFPISGQHCRMDEFPGTILYYYEVKGDLFNMGLSDGAIPDRESFNLPKKHTESAETRTPRIMPNRKIRKSNPEEKGFGVFLGVMVSADSVCSFGRLIFSLPDNSWIGTYPNSYAIQTGRYYYQFWLAGESHQYDLPERAIQLRQEGNDINVHGCGLVLDPEDKLWIFFHIEWATPGSENSTQSNGGSPLPSSHNGAECVIYCGQFWR